MTKNHLSHVTVSVEILLSFSHNRRICWDIQIHFCLQRCSLLQIEISHLYSVEEIIRELFDFKMPRLIRIIHFREPYTCNKNH